MEEEGGSEERKLVPMNDMGDKMQFVGKGCSTLGFRILPQKLDLLHFHLQVVRGDSMQAMHCSYPSFLRDLVSMSIIIAVTGLFLRHKIFRS